jgi:DNA-binding NarL/FixJ family response regulator
VLRLVATGLSARQVADRLVLSDRTVQNHVQNTPRKLQLHNRVELTRCAIERARTLTSLPDLRAPAGGIMGG